MAIKIKHKKRQWIFGYLFLSLWMIGFLVFTFLPIARSFYYSLTDYRITSEGLEGRFVNFGNYFDIFAKDVKFLEALVNYLRYLLIMVPSIIVFSVIIALILNQKFIFRGFWRTIYFLPVIITSGPVLKKLSNQGATSLKLNTDIGLLSAFQTRLPSTLNTILDTVFNRIITVLWFTGVPVIILLAGLQKINKSVYEAAEIDGASRWEIFWKITLPSLKSLININIIYIVVSMSVFTNNEVAYLIENKKITVYGYANAQAWIYFILLILLIMVFLLIVNLRRKKKYKRISYQ